MAKVKANFKKCLAITLGYEGGYSDNPKDPGGATMRGITQKVYDDYRQGSSRDAKPVREITNAELQDIYRVQYWDRSHCSDLPDGVDLVVFDYAVNSGTGRAVKDLQRTVGCVADGVAGVGTVAAIGRMDGSTIINAVCDRRLAFLRGLRTWGAFGNGWSARVQNVRQQALALAVEEAVQPEALPEVLVDAASSKAPPSSQAQLKTAEGSGLTIGGIGGAGQGAMTAAQQVQPHISETVWGRAAFAVFLVLMFVGGLLVGYSYLKRVKDAGGLAPMLQGLV